MGRDERFWDFMAGGQDRFERRLEPLMAKITENVQGLLDPHDFVLDFGCGTGAVTLAIAPFAKRVCGVDISSNVLEIARHKAGAAGIANVEFKRVTDIESLSTPEPVDVILATGVLHFFRTPAEAVAGLSELLRPGGLFISSTPCLAERMTPSTALQFCPFLILSRLGLFPYLKRFRFHEVDALFTGDLQVVKTEVIFHNLSGYFVVARKQSQSAAEDSPSRDRSASAG